MMIVITTVKREPQYIHQTLASLSMSDPLVHELPPIHLMVGSDDSEYLRHYEHHPRIEIHPMDSGEWKRVGDRGVHQRACHNYYRCFRVPLDDCDGVCVCEDDVVFAHGFLSRLLATIEEIEGSHQPDSYILAGYVPYRFDEDARLALGDLFSHYPTRLYFGCQCMYYPAAVVPSLADYLFRRGVENYEAPCDILVKDYCIERYQRILACTRSLVQHIGRRTTGLGNFHRSPTFPPT